MSRLTLIHNHHEFLTAVGDRPGRYLFLNAVFAGGEPEAIRLNITAPNSSYCRADGQSGYFRQEEIPFQIASPGVLLSSSQLTDWRDNFAVVHSVMENLSLGTLSQNDGRNRELLPRLQNLAFQLIFINSLLSELEVETNLYKDYQRGVASVSLMQDQQLGDRGKLLLQNFQAALAIYQQIPELRNYLIQDQARTGDLGPRGQVFRQEFCQAQCLQTPTGVQLDYIAYELRPLRLQGPEFTWKQSPENLEANRRDLRRVSVDLLCRYQGEPVWTELKMANDTWTSSALQQILFYGSMLAGHHQKKRLQQFFGDQFENIQPWLGILVEQRNDTGFEKDFQQTLTYVQHQDVLPVICQEFAGVLIGKITRQGEDWCLTELHVFRHDLQN